MTTVHGHDLTFIETPGGNAGAAIASPSRGAGEVSVIRQRQQPGGFNPPHSHDREEVMVVLSGSVTIALAEETVALASGDAMIVPAGTSHQVENSGDRPAEWLLVAPAGIRFFHATGDEAHPVWAR